MGLESYASDLNPVAVMINKAMIEIPPRFANSKPVGPIPAGEDHDSLFKKEWKGAEGLAEDVRRYGRKVLDGANKKLAHLYPQIEITAEIVNNRPDLKALLGKKLTVIAWLWARTVKSQNPAYSDIDVPLVSSFLLAQRGAKKLLC